MMITVTLMIDRQVLADRVSVLNVNGWAGRNGVLREEIINGANKDIFCVVETDLINDDNVAVHDHKWFGHNQHNVHRLVPKWSGGVGEFIRKDLQEYSCNVVDKSFDGILGLLLEHIVSGYKCFLPGIEN